MLNQLKSKFVFYTQRVTNNRKLPALTVNTNRTIIISKWISNKLEKQLHSNFLLVWVEQYFHKIWAILAKTHTKCSQYFSCILNLQNILFNFFAIEFYTSPFTFSTKEWISIVFTNHFSGKKLKFKKSSKSLIIFK